jgi:hypothetical protein
MPWFRCNKFYRQRILLPSGGIILKGLDSIHQHVDPAQTTRSLGWRGVLRSNPMVAAAISTPDRRKRLQRPSNLDLFTHSSPGHEP